MREHASSRLLSVYPDVLPLRASLSSRGALSDSDFRVWIAEWATLPARNHRSFHRTGAILTHENQQYLLSRENWGTLTGNRTTQCTENKTLVKPLTSWDGPLSANVRSKQPQI